MLLTLKEVDKTSRLLAPLTVVAACHVEGNGMMRLRAILAATVALTMGGSVAHGAILEYDWSGTVSSGTDLTGGFGAAGSNLAGDSYTATFLFNDALGTEVVFPGQLTELNGGPSNYGDVSPALETTLTINDRTASFFGGGQGNVSDYPAGSEYLTYSSANTMATPFDASFLAQDLTTADAPATLETNFTGTGQPGNLNQFQIAQGQLFEGGNDASGVLAPTMVTERVISAAPEPSTWLLMVAGLGGIGLTLRRRRHYVERSDRF